MQANTQEKPPAPYPTGTRLLHAAERDEKSSGVTRSQEANSAKRPSHKRVRRHGTANGHGTAHEEPPKGAQRTEMVAHLDSIPRPLRWFNE